MTPFADEARGYWREAKELHLVFATIFRGSKAHRPSAAESNGEDD